MNGKKEEGNGERVYILTRVITVLAADDDVLRILIKQQSRDVCILLTEQFIPNPVTDVRHQINSNDKFIGKCWRRRRVDFGARLKGKWMSWG